MFSLLGKTLVMLVGVISIFCLMGGVAVYTQKMDYATPRGGEAGKKTLNRVDQARAKVKDLLAANQRAITRLSLEMEPLVDLEGDRLQRRDFYFAQLEMLQTGKWYDKPVAEPIQELRYGIDTTLTSDITDTATSITVASSAGFPSTPFDTKIGAEEIHVTNVTRTTWTTVRGQNGTRAESHALGDTVVAAATGRDRLVRIHTDKEKPPTNPSIKIFSRNMDKPARPSSELLAEIQKIDTDIDKKIVDIRALIAEHAKATLEINGSQDPGMLQKGLRTRIAEQIKIAEDAIAEKNFLEDYVSRRQAESELFVKRRDAMADRLDELKKFFKIIDVPAPGN
jgi:hypothetical protein